MTQHNLSSVEAGARAAVEGWHDWDTLTGYEREQWTALAGRVLDAAAGALQDTAAMTVLERDLYATYGQHDTERTRRLAERVLYVLAAAGFAVTPADTETKP